MALTEKAREYTSSMQLRVQVEEPFRRLARRSPVEAQITIISLQRILQNQIQSNKRNVG